MKLVVGFDDVEYGTATLDGEGGIDLEGSRPDVLQSLLERWPDLQGEELLKRADQACNGRFWAALSNDETTENAELSGGQWVTTDDGNRLYIKDGQPVAGNPHVLKAAGGKGQDQSAGKPNPFASGSRKKYTPSESPPQTEKVPKTVKEQPPTTPHTPVAQHAPAGSKPVNAPTEADQKDPNSPYWRDQAPKDAQGFYGAAKAKLAGWAKDFYDSLPNSTAEGGLGPTVGKGAQKLINGAVWMEGKLSGAYDAGQRLAHAVAKERGYSDAEANRAARTLAVADSVSRWGVNWQVAEAFGAALGGPVGLATVAAGAKFTYYVPAASLAFVGLHMGRELAEGKNPLAMLSRARGRAREWKAKADKQTRNVSRTAYTTVRDWTGAVMDWYDKLDDADRDDAEALLAACLDETRGDKSAALELAKEVWDADYASKPTAKASKKRPVVNKRKAKR